MPRLGQYEAVLDTVFFLYASAEDAKAGKKFGGTGFLVSQQTKNWPDKFSHMYGVTNWHVACRDGFSVVRLNTVDGGTEIYDLGPEDWHFKPNWHDVAITPLSIRDHHKAKALHPNFIQSPEDEARRKIGPGDDVFMVGRFVDYDGIQQNEPFVRFGHISMKSVPIKQPNGYMGGSIVIDMHSRTGFSGSPVFVYRTAGSEFAEKDKIFAGGHMMLLLGIHWGQFPELWELRAKLSKKEADESSLITEGNYVEGLSGMTCVCPASAIQEVLKLSALEKIRQAVEKAIEETEGSAASAPHAETASATSTKDSNPSHKEDFTALLGEATRKQKRDG